ncbi:hypothetical protein ASG50_01730 [Rhizobium sp. Leaf386]|nr:hypothetical protein ASG50_01730 [Rhizobium sp. Leaf386]
MADTWTILIFLRALKALLILEIWIGSLEKAVPGQVLVIKQKHKIIRTKNKKDAFADDIFIRATPTALLYCRL